MERFGTVCFAIGIRRSKRTGREGLRQGEVAGKQGRSPWTRGLKPQAAAPIPSSLASLDRTPMNHRTSFCVAAAALLALPAAAQTARQLTTHPSTSASFPVGDLTGDGIPEYAIADTLPPIVLPPAAQPPPTVSILDGSTALAATPTVVSTLVGENTFSCLPGPPFVSSRFGASFAAADINGDGAVDFLVGSPDQEGSTALACQTQRAGRLDVFLSPNLVTPSLRISGVSQDAALGIEIEMVAGSSHPGGPRALVSGANFTLLIDPTGATNPGNSGVVFNHFGTPGPMCAVGDIDSDGSREYALAGANGQTIEIFDAASGTLEQVITVASPTIAGSIADMVLVREDSSAGGSRFAASWPLASNGNGVVLVFDGTGSIAEFPGSLNEGLGIRLASGGDVNFPSANPSDSIDDFVALSDGISPASSARVSLDQVTQKFQGQSIVLPAGQSAVGASLVGDINGDDHSEILVTTSANTAILFAGGQEAEEEVLPACPAGIGFSLFPTTSAIPGTALNLVVSGAGSNVPATLFLGEPSAIGIPSGFGCNLMFTNLAATVSIPIGNTTAGGGLTLPLAIDISLLGQVLGFQVVTLAGTTLDFSNGLSARVGW